MTEPTAAASSGGSMTVGRMITLIIALIAFTIPWLINFPGLSPEGHRVLSVFLLAVVLWLTEAIPLHATAVLIIFLLILFISDRALIPLPEEYAPDAVSFGQYFATLADPILMLFLGGFVLANCASKYHLDKNLARVVLRPFGTSPIWIIFGLMLVTAVFSMFMSNTATAATMMAVVLPIIRTLPPGDRLAAGLALSIPFAANLGGIGTPIGTPPNAIAVSAMFEAGYDVGFFDWMMMMLPFVIVVMVAAWLMIGWFFRSDTKEIKLQIDSKFNLEPAAIIFYVTFAVTVLLWMTEALHGMASTMVGFLPVVVLISTGVFTTKDMQSIQWHVLWLMAGGIALGAGVRHSGLDQWMIGLVDWEQVGTLLLVALLSIISIILSTFISNTATANLIVPLGLTLAASSGVAISPVEAGVFIAVSCSLAMALPVSTPPNAIAYSTGVFSTRNMMIMGAMIGVVGWVIFIQFAPLVWDALGLMPEVTPQ